MFYSPILWINYAVFALFMVYLVFQCRAAAKNRPRISKFEIVYQEWFASGFSEANLLTRIGGSRNCLRLIVTSEYLIVTSWFPFLLFSAFYDMEHVIPLDSLLPIQQKHFLCHRYLEIAYQDQQAHSHKIALKPADSERFLAAVGQMKPPA